MQPTRRIAVDFDGTLCDQAFPHIGKIKPGAKEALTVFRALGFKVVIWTCRTCHWDYDVYGGDPSEPTMERERVKEMVRWLNDNGIPYDEIDDGSKGKPGADYYIDDKGIRFSDNWENIASAIMAREMAENALPPKSTSTGKVLKFPTPAEDNDGGPQVA